MDSSAFFSLAGSAGSGQGLVFPNESPEAADRGLPMRSCPTRHTLLARNRVLCCLRIARLPEGSAQHGGDAGAAGRSRARRPHPLADVREARQQFGQH